MNYLGVDWGEKRIGLALADSETKIATPFKVVGNLQEVMAEIKKEEIDVIVVGKPLPIFNFSAKGGSVSGGQFPISKQFGEFIKLLKKKINIPVEMADERLSSKAADALSGTKKTKAPRDAVAAMLILQGHLDKLKMKETNIDTKITNSKLTQSFSKFAKIK